MEESKKKIQWDSESNLRLLSYFTFMLLCLSMVVKDFYQVSVTINTLPYYSDLSVDLTNVNATWISVFVFAGYALLYGGIVEILSRFVANSIMRVSFNTINKYKFISVFKLILTGVNLLIGCFNFMYFEMPFTYSLQTIVEIVFLSVTFAVMFVIFYKKYLNKKSAPVIFLSMALPLSIYFIFLAI